MSLEKHLTISHIRLTPILATCRLQVALNISQFTFQSIKTFQCDCVILNTLFKHLLNLIIKLFTLFKSQSSRSFINIYDIRPVCDNIIEE